MNEPTKHTDPLYDAEYWKYRTRCRNCGRVETWLGDLKKDASYADWNLYMRRITIHGFTFIMSELAS